MSAPCSEFTKEEREGGVVALTGTLSMAINDPVHKMIVLSLTDHLRRDHKFSHEGALKIIVSMESEALRRVADLLEEKAVEFIKAL